MQIKNDAEKFSDFLIKIRRDVHENPELGFKEFKTAELICKELDALGIPYDKNIAITGIVATLKGGKGEGKTLLIRADMDALPLKEETNLPFKSKHEGVFHACGHDAHVSCLLGTARLLKSKQNEFKGTIKFVFQPAEETSNVLHPEGSGGALPMIESYPELKNVDAALALHIVAGEEEYSHFGKIGVKDGPFTGSADEFYITVKGKGGHASAPHTAIDPVYIASQIYIAIQGFLTRTIDPLEPVVFTAGRISGGLRHNIISETCQMDCTLRTLNEEVREKIHNTLPDTIKNIAKSFGGDADVDLKKGYAVGFNDKTINHHIRKVTSELYGSDAIAEVKAVLGAEDFYEFGFKNKIPISMFWLGGANKEKGMIYPNHSSHFEYDERALPMGTAILVGTALSYLNEN
jgi:amidohydrolase